MEHQAVKVKFIYCVYFCKAYSADIVYAYCIYRARFTVRKSSLESCTKSLRILNCVNVYKYFDI